MKLAWRPGILAYHDLHSCRNISAFQFESMHPRLASELRKPQMLPECRQRLGDGRFEQRSRREKVLINYGMLAILRDACSMNLHSTPSGPPLFINWKLSVFT